MQEERLYKLRYHELASSLLTILVSLRYVRILSLSIESFCVGLLWDGVSWEELKLFYTLDREELAPIIYDNHVRSTPYVIALLPRELDQGTHVSV